MFRDRRDSGRQLGERLSSYAREEAVVLALPRGGVVLGHEIAQALGLPLGIVVTRKIGHPQNPEYAVCAIDESGELLCNDAEARSIDVAWLREEGKRQQAEAQRRSKVYRQGMLPTAVRGKTVIITDDGIATGLTMRLAVRVVRAQKPKRIIVAVPVAPLDVVALAPKVLPSIPEH